MNTRPILLLLVVALLGCESESSTSDLDSRKTKAKTGRFVWDREERPYRVLKLEEKNHMWPSDDKLNSQLAVVHRNAYVAYSGELNREAVLKAAKELYEEFKRDIEKTCRSARHKRVNVKLYHPDQKIGDIPLFQIISSDGAVRNLPDWDGANRQWFDERKYRTSQKMRGFEKGR